MKYECLKQMLNMFDEMGNLLVFTTLNVVPMGAQIEFSGCGPNVLSSQFLHSMSCPL